MISNLTKDGIMYKKILGTVALAFTLAMSSTVFAHSMECGQGLKQMVESLKLDDSQKQKIKPILESLKSNIKQSADQMQDLRKQIDDQVTSATMDQSSVNDLIDKKAKLIGDMMKAKAMAKNQIYAVLNAQQKTQLQGMMKNAKEKMEEQFKSCHEQE